MTRLKSFRNIPRVVLYTTKQGTLNYVCTYVPNGSSFSIYTEHVNFNLITYVLLSKSF